MKIVEVSLSEDFDKFLYKDTEENWWQTSDINIKAIENKVDEIMRKEAIAVKVQAEDFLAEVKYEDEHTELLVIYDYEMEFKRGVPTALSKLMQKDSSTNKEYINKLMKAYSEEIEIDWDENAILLSIVEEKIQIQVALAVDEDEKEVWLGRYALGDYREFYFTADGIEENVCGLKHKCKVFELCSYEYALKNGLFRTDPIGDAVKLALEKYPEELELLLSIRSGVYKKFIDLTFSRIDEVFL